MGKFGGITAVLLAVVLGGCGGGGTKASSTTGGSSGSKAPSTATTVAAANVDKVLTSALEVSTGARGKKVDAPGKLRFANYFSKDGKAVDLDLWWGQPDEGQKAATIKFGEVSPYLTPKQTEGFTSAAYSMTEVGNPKVVVGGDDVTTTKDLQRTIIWSAGGTGISLGSVGESLTLIDAYTGKIELGPPASGKVGLQWIVLGDVLETPDNLLAVTSGGICLTNGTQIADPTDPLGNALKGPNGEVQDRFDADPGAVLTFTVGCGGAPTGNTVTVPAKGRGLLVAYFDPAGKPVLALIPVADTP
jgi:hypothetical protein